MAMALNFMKNLSPEALKLPFFLNLKKTEKSPQKMDFLSILPEIYLILIFFCT